MQAVPADQLGLVDHYVLYFRLLDLFFYFRIVLGVFFFRIALTLRRKWARQWGEATMVEVEETMGQETMLKEDRGPEAIVEEAETIRLG